MSDVIKKRIRKCENCGNEAEVVMLFYWGTGDIELAFLKHSTI